MRPGNGTAGAHHADTHDQGHRARGGQTNSGSVFGASGAAAEGSSQSRTRELFGAVRSSAQSVSQADSASAQPAQGSLQKPRPRWPWPASVDPPHSTIADDQHEHQHADDGSCCPPCMEQARKAVPAEERRLRLERLYAQLQLLEMNGHDTTV